MIYILNDELSAQILTNMLDNTDPAIDQREGTPTYTVLAPTADEIANLYAELDAAKRSAFLLDAEGNITMAGVDLTLWAAAFGVDRKPGEKATGQVTFTADSSVLVPAGTLVFAPATVNVLFRTLTDVTATTTGVVADIEAVEDGSEGNVSANTITGVVGNLVSTVTVTNLAETTGGLNEESDEELTGRLLNYVRRPATSGNVNDYYQWATEVPGVKDALVQRVWAGPGTVRVILLSNEHDTPAPEIITAVEENIEEKRPLDTITVTVIGATEVPVNVTANVTLAAGAKVETTKLDFETQITTYLQSLLFNGDIVRITRLQNFLLDSDGVLDFNSFTLNGGTANVELQAGQVGVLGTVTLNVV